MSTETEEDKDAGTFEIRETIETGAVLYVYG